MLVSTACIEHNHVSLTIVYYSVHGDIHLKPYKFDLWHKLKDKTYNAEFSPDFLNCQINIYYTEMTPFF